MKKSTVYYSLAIFSVAAVLTISVQALAREVNSDDNSPVMAAANCPNPNYLKDRGFFTQKKDELGEILSEKEAILQEKRISLDKKLADTIAGRQSRSLAGRLERDLKSAQDLAKRHQNLNDSAIGEAFQSFQNSLSQALTQKKTDLENIKNQRKSDIDNASTIRQTAAKDAMDARKKAIDAAENDFDLSVCQAASGDQVSAAKTQFKNARQKAANDYKSALLSANETLRLALDKIKSNYNNDLKNIESAFQSAADSAKSGFNSAISTKTS